ncbi:MAG: DUF1972 domain-containing protein [Acidobacteriota bacterium]|nr:MAG: DUF1972 domain-containing protein [Acidobacteriota bacterium]
MKVAILGTRGIPANYGGFETFAEELSKRLVGRGHQVTVYCRHHYTDAPLDSYNGVQLRQLPAIRTKYFDTVSHTLLSAGDALVRSFDIVLICNAANAFLTWIPQLKGQKVILNVDGIERRRQKWGRPGKLFYRLSERLSTWFPNAVVTDALAVKRYYRERLGCPSYFIPYGAPVEKLPTRKALDELGIEPGEYLLYVSRLEPENNAHRVIEAFRESGVSLPLVVVGDAPYSPNYISSLKELAAGANVKMPGAIYGEGYRELLSHCRCYFHGCEVGGTHPALLEAMGAGALVISHEAAENREVLAETGLYCSFHETAELANCIKTIAKDSASFDDLRNAAQERIRRDYDWEKVTDMYEELFYEFSQ